MNPSFLSSKHTVSLDKPLSFTVRKEEKKKREREKPSQFTVMNFVKCGPEQQNTNRKQLK